ncbi:fatty acid hydroxylase superfamily-domain-containing protein [Lasiosphaeria miniovina]|uniref:Fatty acid hydroxylase superfamily-domain-containing protein n=1 Tax=Lasiosphaeria miniovina TaxID=1954250 RepID=A0AA40DQ30_9PEZI|nr:fatty acid hydroxylase superfamily-domain-containing protein [Lasiosphaeria miniovina]KAK0709072.1 fatty acid hydroxylase superfamily-domain-containing protein [Lasiosphaeria miniovina]
MANATVAAHGLPPLPAFEVRPMPDLLPFISDFWLSLVLPHIAYWAVSMFFHFIDIYDLFPQYRLHTPEEITQRNLVSRFDVARDVFLEQIIQIATSAFLSLTEARQMTGMQDYDIAVWATRIRLAQRALPGFLGLLGLNAAAISQNMASEHPLLAGALAGGHYPFLTTELEGVTGTHVPAFAAWEMLVAKALYWLLIPTIQVCVAVCFLDTWQYFVHRAMHVNKWMYTKWHARHHRLYVPYAYGALYNHPVEAFVMDTLGAGLAYKVSMMTPRFGMWFFVFSMIKTVDDHCGYVLPWDPLQHVSSNNAAYHDIHHQSWGIKSNFSQPYLTFWDRILGTMWKGDTKLKYARTREAAASKAPKKQQ